MHDYLAAAYGDASGRAHMAEGVRGYFDDAGSYKFKRTDDHPDARWAPSHYAWPAEADRLAAEILRAAPESDVYLCPYLMSGTKRTPDDAVALTKIHADIDGDCPIDKVTALGGWAVSTGSPGHAHVYVDLTEPIPEHWHTALCRGLGAHLGHADAKIKPNDVLRPPGTSNHKNRARGGESTPVEWLIRPTGVRWDAAELADPLGVTLPETPDTGTRAKRRARATGSGTGSGSGATIGITEATADEDDDGTPFDLSAHPRVMRALANVSNPPDRSKDTMRVIAAVYDAGLTFENALWGLAQRDDLAERLCERRDDDVLRCWLKIDADRRADAAAAAAASVGDSQYKDAYVSEHIAREYLGDFVHSAAFGWRRWDGRRWALVDAGVVLDTVRRAVIEMHTTAARGRAEVASLQEIDALLGERRIAGILKLCAGIRTVESGDFDRYPDLLNVGNGVVDLRTGELAPHDRDLMLTTLTPTDYVAGATHPDWTAALGAVSTEEADYLQVRLGQGITGHQPDDDKVVLLQGTGSNGKTVIVDGITHSVGEDHAVVVPEKVLLARPGDHPTELMTLRGARLALIEELPGGATLDVKRLKTVAGTGTVTARLCAKDNVSWRPTHSLFLTTNYLPRVSESDFGTWRRLLRVLFRLTFRPPGEALCGPDDRPGDPALRERVRRGGDGLHEAVLAWLVEGARCWYEAGRVMRAMPESTIEATHEWRTHADLLLRYADEYLVFDGTRHVKSDELYQHFVEWLKAGGHQPWSDQRFTERLRDHSALGEHRLEKRRVAINRSTQQTLSRPNGAYGMTMRGGKYTAWFGVQFRTNDDNIGDDSE